MKRPPFFFLFLLFLLHACNNDNKPTGKSENDIDAARNFIRAALDGKFDNARTYLLPDSVNANWIDVAERSYRNSDAETKNGYRSSSINIYKVDSLNETTTLVYYSNSYKKHQYILRVSKIKGQWLVDLDYLYKHDLETSPDKPVNKDTVK
jgi:hypothetical protein